MITLQEMANIGLIEHYIGKPFTDEQKEFIHDFRQNIISFSNPGTGKTHSLVGGIILATKSHGVPQDSIICMSFTNAAVAEIKGRYQSLTKAMYMPTGCKFTTFHKLTLQILKDAYPRMQVSQRSLEEDVRRIGQLINSRCPDLRGEIDLGYARQVMGAINTLNSSFIFEPNRIKETFVFKELNMEYSDFEYIRKQRFMSGLISNTIDKGDIPLYCLFALLTEPEVSKKWYGSYEIMIVDEFQDLSMLHLNILSRVAKTLVAVGDMKQQIYAFNGACPDIVDAYCKARPDHLVINLTQSFRCSQKIADYATAIIKPNDPSVISFTGHDGPSSINLIPKANLDWKALLEGTTLQNTYDYMILYRNQASLMPVIETLYTKGIPFRVGDGRTVSVCEIPVIDTLCTLANAAWHPNDKTLVGKALMKFPEFRTYGFDQPIVKAMTSSLKSLFDVKYRYTQQSSIDILNAMRKAGELISEGRSAPAVITSLKSVYLAYIYNTEKYKMQYDSEYYFNMAAPACNGRDYPTFITRESNKVIRAQECKDAGTGVRCYTIHAAKGLEADNVYILDCEEGMFPNAKKLKDKMKAGCQLEAAVDIRSERNLLYVAITRAKSNVTICYKDNPCELIVNPNNPYYTAFDKIYKEEHKIYDDTEAFISSYNQGGKQDKEPSVYDDALKKMTGDDLSDLQ